MSAFPRMEISGVAVGPKISVIEVNWCTGRNCVEAQFFAGEVLTTSLFLFERPAPGMIDLMLSAENPYREFALPLRLFVDCQEQHVAPTKVAESLAIAVGLIFDIQRLSKH